MEKRTSSLRPSAPIQLPQSPIWGWLLVAIIAVLVIVGIALIFAETEGTPSIGGGCVGVVEIDGEIIANDVADSLFSSGQAGSEQIAKEIEEADKRSDVKSILMIVNSPGGSVVASNEIYQAFKSAKKPKVAYFREMAASGGYEAALGADYIISEPDALTGSIGARMTLSQMSGLFEKIGYNETTIKSGEMKDIGSPSREITPKEMEVLQSIVNESFNEFKNVVVENRKGKLDMTRFESEVLDARVLSGRQAYKLGLVDALGSKKDAIAKASKMAGSNKSLEVCAMQKKQSGLFSSLFAGAFESVIPSFVKSKMSLGY
ncbi:MAG: signal peptide peptidase SppA [Candidatus Micrarchaeia archaeon]